MRADLHGILSSALGEGVIRFGSQVTGFAQDADGVTVSVDGAEDERADVLVAADGVRSFVRDELLSDHGAIHGGLIEWHAPVDAPDLVPDGPTGRCGGAARALASTRSSRARAGTSSSAARPTRRAILKGPRRRRSSAHKPFPSPSLALVEATPAAAVYRLDIWLREPAKRWSHGRVTLLGDAAHAMTPNLGQGAAQSIEDAIVLAKCLRDESDVTAALREYERRRLEHVNDVAQQARRLARMARWRNPVLCATRDRLAVPIWRSSGRRQFLAIHEHDF